MSLIFPLIFCVLLLAAPICGQGRPPPAEGMGGGQQQGGGRMSLSDELLRVMAKHAEARLPHISSDQVVHKVERVLGIQPGRKK